MKVLFLYPLWTGESKGIAGYFAKTSGGTYIPYNLAILASITEKQGHHAKIIDGELEKIGLEELTEKASNVLPSGIICAGTSKCVPVCVPIVKLCKRVRSLSISFSCTIDMSGSDGYVDISLEIG